MDVGGLTGTGTFEVGGVFSGVGTLPLEALNPSSSLPLCAVGGGI